MGKNELMCQTCANQVNGNHCTMMKEMAVQSRIYKKCDGYKKYMPKPKPIATKKVIENLFGIDVENPFKYYGTYNINAFPKHLRKNAKRILIINSDTEEGRG